MTFIAVSVFQLPVFIEDDFLSDSVDRVDVRADADVYCEGL
jgi:hypothetical protein